MKLDSRIVEGKRPLDCFDAENRELMKSFLNKQGYFSNNLENFCFLIKCTKRCLSNVFKDISKCFTAHIESGGSDDWRYFLPAEWVKEPEKKYRPFTLEEFQDKFEIGKVIRFRRKGDDREHRLMLVGYIPYLVYEGSWILLGDIRFSTETLFKDCELYDSVTEKYVPFGIEE